MSRLVRLAHPTFRQVPVRPTSTTIFWLTGALAFATLYMTQTMLSVLTVTF